ncbi:ATP/GTP-binding protein [Streptomyces sp. NPDC127166]|uniref:AAA family ATPase n=1 Tax=Streptomyces sp. NPDC127166 TaxID=3345380 RepID=UPI0036424730
MLLRFRVANVRSLRDEQELSFVAPDDAEAECAAARETRLSDGRQLPVHTVLGLFGSNASGKSNIVAALKNMRHAVLRSYTDWTSYDGIPREEFALDAKAASETSLYEADILLEDGVRWTYGFELGSRRVEAEWLYAYPKGRRQVWYERDASREKLIDFPGDRLHDRAGLTRMATPDALLLTRAGNAGHEQLTPVFDWFRDNLWDVTPETERTQREAYTALRLLNSEEFRRRAEELLRVADLGIAGVEVEQTSSGRPLVRLSHTGGGGTTLMDWSSESWGTRSWFALIGPLLLALDSGAILLVDELDASLHPRFAAEVIRLFQSPRVNRKGAQLLFTGHDPSLLRAPGGARLLQPGQIWLTEKDEQGATVLSSVADWEPTDDEDLMASYLAGTFGAVPRVSEGQIGRRLLRTDELARTGTEEN